MKKIIIALLLCAICTAIKAQDNEPEPAYPGGNQALVTLIMQNLRYPKECFEENIQGKVMVRFKVKKNGRIADAEVTSSPHRLMSDEALRIVGLMPDWIPAEKDGKKVESEVVLPISFRLGNGSAPTKSDKPKKALADVKPETIETCAANQHETEWYEQQSRAWQKVVDTNPTDQWAWRNLFRATYYVDMFNRTFTDSTCATQRVMEQMEQRLPDSFVFHLCKLRYDKANEPHKHIKRAIELMPGNVCAEDVSYIAAHAWIYANEIDEATLKRLFTKAHRMQAIPERIMRYNWNMLSATMDNALYFGNGDNCLVPGKMMQEALEFRPDITIIPLSYLCCEEFRTSTLEKLGIRPFECSPNFSEYAKYGDNWQKRFYADIVMHIIRETGRPAYFFPDVMSHAALCPDSLYNEGLLLKYSDKPYDNFGVAMRNVEDTYHLEYLSEPQLVYNPWETGNMLDINYIPMLSGLVSKFSDRGKDEEASKLLKALTGCLEKSSATGFHREHLQKMLDEQAEAISKNKRKQAR